MAKELGHKHERQDLKALLEERNQQNAFLREQLVARIERAAHLEARLLSTLDALDELQASATLDLQQAQRDNARLVKKLDVCQAVARAADREKSDMSNAVLQLVAKVESCNDYSKWQASRIEFSHDITLHPIRSKKATGVLSYGEDSNECTCARAYSPAIIEELSDSLTKEKQAHARTVGEAERRISALQSRVAARDAEITRRAATCRCLPMSPFSGASGQLELLSEEERARIAAQTAERNCVLESDITLLEKKLERGRGSYKSALSRRVEQSVQTDSPTSSRFPYPPQHHDVNAFVTSVSDDGYDALPAALSTLDSQIDQLRKGLTDLVMEKEALRLVLRNELDVKDPGLLQNPRRLQRAERLEPVGNFKDEGTKDLDVRRIDEERKGQDDFKNVLLLEEECIRLMRSEDSLRASLERSQCREALLSDENARLKEENSILRAAETRRDDRPPPPSLPPLDTSAIDLAFPPLQPVSISLANKSVRKRNEHFVSGARGRTDRTVSSSSASSPSSLATPTSLIDPSEVPLPITPTFDDAEAEIEDDDGDGAGGIEEPHANFIVPPSPQRPQEPSPPPPPGTSLPPAGTRDVEAITRELADARADAEMREREIAEVRDLVADLALRVGGELQGS